jgi:hypothetical protein
MTHEDCGPFRIVRVDRLGIDWRGRQEWETVTCDGAGHYVYYITAREPLTEEDVNNTRLCQFVESREPASQLS